MSEHVIHEVRAFFKNGAPKVSYRCSRCGLQDQFEDKIKAEPCKPGMHRYAGKARRVMGYMPPKPTCATCLHASSMNCSLLGLGVIYHCTYIKGVPFEIEPGGRCHKHSTKHKNEGVEQ